MTNKAVFLDRDGTIVRDVHYCSRVDDLHLLPTVPIAVRLLNRYGFKTVVITNQSGIARGYFSEEILAHIHRKMVSELQRHKARLDAIYYCPHHPDDSCNCRKPKTALFLQAAQEFDIDLPRSYVVGDMPTDIDAGKALGCKTALITSQAPGIKWHDGGPPDFTAANLFDIARWIIIEAGKRDYQRTNGTILKMKHR